MSGAISEHLKDEIVRIYGQEVKINKFFLFERIPPQKLGNAKNSYARLISNNETVIFLFDDTLFGSSREGFLLTTKRIYYKNIAQTGSFADLSSIQNMTMSHGAIQGKLSLHMPSAVIELTITKANNTQEREAMLRVLRQTIALLTREEARPARYENEALHHCENCGAVKQAGACEYCGSQVR